MSERTPAEEAASWFLRLQEASASAQTFLDWQRWLMMSPEHRIAFDRVEETLLRLARVNAQPHLPSAAQRAADTYDGSVSVSEFLSRMNPDRTPPLRASPPARERTPARRMRIGVRFRYALVAGLAVVLSVGGVWWWNAIRQSQHGVFALSTAPGERRAFILPEGSQITLDADSVLNVVLTPGQRSLRLTRGEAYFQVSKDPVRPFIVSAGETRVRVVGTAFNVRMSDHRTVIAVLEGKVNVTALKVSDSYPPSASSKSNLRPSPAATPLSSRQLVAQVAAGQAVAYAEDGILQTLPDTEALIATTWLNGRRQYLNEPLRDVLADVNRYTGQSIEVADAATGRLSFTGTLNLEKSNAWLKGLSIALPVTVTQQSDGTLLVAPTNPR